MEASVAPRSLDGEKARAIVEAMRSSVAARGAAASTFDHVAREAGVSRGLLHYYFGSKERLLVEVVRRDCEERVEALERRLAGASSPDEMVEALVEQLKSFLEDDPGSPAVVYEMLSASRHSEEIRLELAELYRTWRSHLAESLRAKEAEGVVRARRRPRVGGLGDLRDGRRDRHAAALRSRVGLDRRTRAGRAERATAAGRVTRVTRAAGRHRPR